MTQTLGYVLKLSGKQEFFSLIVNSQVIFVLEDKREVFKLFASESEAKDMQKYLIKEYDTQTEVVFFDLHDVYGEIVAYLN